MASCSSPSRQPQGLSVAEDALRGGAPAVALQVAHGVLAQAPDNVSALLVEGDAAALLGNNADAEAAYTHVLHIKPDNVRAELGLGRLRLTLDPTGAANLFQEVVKQAPDNLHAWNDLGIARDLLGQHQQAQEAYRKAHKIDPTNIAAQVNMALSLAMSGNGADALELITPLATTPSASPQLRHDYAVVLAMAGREADADKVLAHDLTPAQVNQVLDAARHQRVSGY